SFICVFWIFFFFSSRRRHTRFSRDWSADVCSSDLAARGSPARFSSKNSASSRPAGSSEVTMGALRPVCCACTGAAREARIKVERSEERRVGKEGRSRWARNHQNEIVAKGEELRRDI